MDQFFSKIDSDHPVSLIAREGAPWYLENGDLRQVPYDPRCNDDTG